MGFSIVAIVAIVAIVVIGAIGAIGAIVVINAIVAMVVIPSEVEGPPPSWHLVVVPRQARDDNDND